jgi:hypothetical protein
MIKPGTYKMLFRFRELSKKIIRAFKTFLATRETYKKFKYRKETTHFLLFFLLFSFSAKNEEKYKNNE